MNLTSEKQNSFKGDVDSSDNLKMNYVTKGIDSYFYMVTTSLNKTFPGGNLCTALSSCLRFSENHFLGWLVGLFFFFLGGEIFIFNFRYIQVDLHVYEANIF